MASETWEITMDDARHQGWCDIGDGTAGFCFPPGPSGNGGGAFRLDLTAWRIWESRWKPPEGADAAAFLEAVVVRVKDVAGIDIRAGQAEALLHAIGLEQDRIRLFREAERSSLLSTASTS